jgi:SAM-dependent methyltransferase
VPFLDLGSAPPSNAYLTAEALKVPERVFPLKVRVCTSCWLVQTEDVLSPEELFDADYSFFSGFSATWLAHVERYVADVVARFGLTANRHVVEVGANDGSLLQFFQARGIPCTGIEPTARTAAAARAKGIAMVEGFFGLGLAEGGGLRRADLIVANNVLAHVPDINDFVAGFAALLKPEGVATFEFPHLLRLVAGNQFDTVYHEHYSYLSLTAVDRIFAANGLAVFDVEEITTHGGSLRVFAQRSGGGRWPRGERVSHILQCEQLAGMKTAQYYAGFQRKADKVTNDFRDFLVRVRGQRKKVAAYGAAAKGNTLMNYAGVRADLLPYVVDRNPAKQGKVMPGSRIPIVPEARLRQDKPDYVVIFPWNLHDELVDQLDYITAWGGKFVTAVPQLRVSP